MLVKDFPNWQKIIFKDRAILKEDVRYFSWEQIKSLDNLEVVLEEDNGKTLIVENR